MRTLLRNLLLLTLCLAPSIALAQDGKYITGVTLELSTGDWTALWLNGHKIFEFDPHTYEGRADQKDRITVKFTDDQICYFQPQNLFAIRMTHTLTRAGNTDYNSQDYMGLAYVLTLSYSDNSQERITTNQSDQNRTLHLGKKGDAEPNGWNAPGFDESGWETADVLTTHKTIAVVLKDPDTGRPMKYLAGYSASNGGGNSLNNLSTEEGEKRLFRRAFNLSVIPAPQCAPFKPTATSTRAYQKPTATSTRTPVPTPTPRPKPTATYTRTPRPIPTATATHVPRASKPTATPTHTPRPHVVKLIPTSTPRPLKKAKYPPTPTPTLRRRAWPTSTPVRHEAPATFTPTVEIAEYAPTTIVFVEPPVNIYVEFADGPGLYKLEVMNASGSHLKTLFEHRMVGDSDQWISWDGKNEQGRLMPYGEYYAHFTRNGKLLRNIVLTWIREKNDQ